MAVRVLRQRTDILRKTGTGEEQCGKVESAELVQMKTQTQINPGSLGLRFLLFP